MNFSRLSVNNVRSHLLSRRAALKGTIIGAAALFPALEGVPGVSAASLGLNQSNIKVQPLTGGLLRQELAKLQALPQFTSAQRFVSQGGFEVADPLAEGYYFYQKTGNHWSKMTFLTLGYTQGTAETAAISYTQNSQSSTVDIVTTNFAAKTGTGYTVHENGVVGMVAQFDTRGNQSTLQLSQQYEQALQSNAVSPQASIQCILCNAVCFGIASTGCSVLGALLECSEICAAFAEDPICLTICAVAYRIICTFGATGDCHYIVCVNALHAC